jgi:hypothetical protein
MKLTKKHIGQLFDNKGSDGSWAYQLVAIKGKELMFYCMSTGKYEVDTNKYADWRHFEPQMHIHERWIESQWETARRAP